MQRQGNDSGALLHRALLNYNLDAAEAALHSGEDINSQDREGRSVIYYAIRDRRNDVVDWALERGANVNAVDKYGETPLHFAARFYNTVAAQRIISQYANIDVRDIYGNTALWRATFESKGRGDIIRLLLKYGADAAMANKSGVSPYQLADRISNHDVKQFFN